MDIAGAAAAGHRLSLPVVEQAAAQSAVAEVPKVGRMAAQTSLSIKGEMTAWELDHNPAHLLRVIHMQQAIIAAHAHSLVAVAHEAAAAHGTISAIAHGLAQSAAPAGLHSGPAASVSASSAARHSAAGGAGAAIERFAHQVAQGAMAPSLHPVGAPAVRSVADVSPHQLQLQMSQAQQLFDSMSNIQKSMHDISKAAISNIR